MNLVVRSGWSGLAQIQIKDHDSGLSLMKRPVTLALGETGLTGLAWTQELDERIENRIYTLDWLISVDGGATFSLFQTTKNRILVLENTPILTNSLASSNALTCQRANLITKIIQDGGTGTGSVDEIATSIMNWRDGVDPNNPFVMNIGQSTVGSDGSKIWGLVDKNQQGYCAEGSLLMEQAMRLLGIQAEYQHVYCATTLPVPVFSPETPSATPPQRTYNSTNEQLYMYFSLAPNNPFNGFNQGEGCCLVNAKLYSAFGGQIVGRAGANRGTKVSSSAAEDILLQLGQPNPNLQRWSYTTSAGTRLASPSGDIVPIP